MLSRSWLRTGSLLGLLASTTTRQRMSVKPTRESPHLGCPRRPTGGSPPPRLTGGHRESVHFVRTFWPHTARSWDKRSTSCVNDPWVGRRDRIPPTTPSSLPGSIAAPGHTPQAGNPVPAGELVTGRDGHAAGAHSLPVETHSRGPNASRPRPVLPARLPSVVQIPRQALGADFLLRIGRRLHPHAKRPAWWRDCSPAH